MPKVAAVAPVPPPPSIAQQIMVGTFAGALAWLLVEHLVKPATQGRRRR